MQLIKFVVSEYDSLLEAAKDYPEWNDKIKQEIGVIVAIVKSVQVRDAKFDEIFAGFEDKDFFK